MKTAHEETTPVAAAEAEGETPSARRGRRARRSHASSRVWVRGSLIGMLALVVGGAVWAGLGAGDGTRTYEIAGEDYTSNVEIKEEAGGVYMYLPVNTDIEEVEVVTADPDTTQQLQEQLQNLDTFVPGEHILELPDTSIHVIIDGIER
ncbi:hypothetical protein [Arthrobacter caoxuetaonis]|uniref:hypothetical protein n=1 Tax=Arthrobacter caoxuetaonis TaxID=2886935 RepID=UPI001D144C3D|nr:hypothetical protein [Arthrobacter caoxuetaonis]MCC3283218.1 hypothetical protein [Arthrobacter caoxuetaonis]